MRRSWLGVAVFFLPWIALLTGRRRRRTAARCAPNCPDNALQIVLGAEARGGAGKWETYIALALAVAVFFVYLLRLLHASRPQRRALLAVAVTSLLFLPAYFVSNFSAWVLVPDQATQRCSGRSSPRESSCRWGS